MKLFLTSGFHGAVLVLLALSIWGVAAEKPVELSKLTDQSVQEKRNVILRANVAGATGAYTWYRDGAAIAGATGPSLALASAEPSDAGRYNYSVGNDGGTLTSEPISLEVEPYRPGAIDTQFDGSKTELFSRDWSLGSLICCQDGTWMAVERSGSRGLLIHYYARDFTPFGTKLVEDVGFSTGYDWSSLRLDTQGRCWITKTSRLPYAPLGTYVIRLARDGKLDTVFSFGGIAASGCLPGSEGGVISVGTNIMGTYSGAFISEDRKSYHQFDPSSLGHLIAALPAGCFLCLRTNPSDAEALPLARVLPNLTLDPSFAAPRVSIRNAVGQTVALNSVYAYPWLSPNGDLILIAHRDSETAAVVCLAQDGSLRWVHPIVRETGSFGVDRLGGIYVATVVDGESSLLRLSADGNETYCVPHPKFGSPINSSDGACYLPYTKVVGGVTIRSATRCLALSPGQIQLAGLAGRGRTGAVDDSLILGYVKKGAQSPVVVRGLGPQLADSGIQGSEPDPVLSLYQGGTQLESNDDWSSSDAELKRSLFAQIGLSPLPEGSKDACLVAQQAEGAFSAIVSSKLAAGGKALAEIYDGVSGGDHLGALALRGFCGQGDDVLIAGFVLNGDGGRWVLVKATGPGLGASGVADALGDPTLSIYDSAGNLVAENDNGAEGDNGLLVAGAARKLGMGQLPSGSLDAATLVWLTPGAYTAVVSDKNGGEGNALIEIYPLF